MNTVNNVRMAEAGAYFTPALFDKWFDCIGDCSCTRAGRSGKVINVPCAFDIETTSLKASDGAPFGTMYAWAFACDGAVMIGRTWPEFCTFMEQLREAFNISPKRRLWIYVHNNQFDFQFYRHYLQVTEVFAREVRRPMFVRDARGFEFRDSLILTNSSLASVGKNLVRLPVKKLEGDLEYKLTRHSATPLTATETQYLINDVLVVTSLIFERMGGERGALNRVPLTQTGYARRECREACLPYSDAKTRWKYIHKMEKMQLTEAEYLMAKRAFLGGFTHASPQHANKIVSDVWSMDFTSSYPAVIVAEEYPMGRGVEVDPATITSREQLRTLCRQKACIMHLELTGVDSRTETDYYLSDSRCEYDEDTTEIFNGRIASSDRVRLICTDVDLSVILKVYDIKGIKVLRIITYVRGYLPKPYVETVLKLYRAKTELKGVESMEEEYQRAKEKLNSLYGMMALQIDSDEITYTNGEWDEPHAPALADVIDGYNKDKFRFISYIWGCFVTAYARRNVWSGIMTCADDYLYSDTDSVKVTNMDAHRDYFDAYNEYITEKINRACDYHKLDRALACPLTKDGKPKPLGVWDFDGHYTRFKTMGAKRYMYETDDGQLHITCAGVGKKAAVRYLLDRYGSNDGAFEAFNDGLVIPGEYTRPDGAVVSGTGKMTHIYNDSEITETVTDYLGNTATVHEMSSIYLEPASYSLGISGKFFDFIRRIQNDLADL